eukprot:5471493-Amphidinium_carterae.1
MPTFESTPCLPVETAHVFLWRGSYRPMPTFLRTFPSSEHAIKAMHRAKDWGHLHRALVRPKPNSSSVEAPGTAEPVEEPDRAVATSNVQVDKRASKGLNACCE